ncbi:hypothetical protein CQW23_05175 [Capsicum baccatum]|uniref:Uncharacterized protein n=1 Tax=Capsicum baccatum TaxID=33114 RepID=A0A2G2XGV3_CAPBA|nr:hypothetical protein CQW23_05175 [Capsicum baccatum]
MDCRAPKKGKKKDQANMIESNKECDDLCAMFSECNLVGILANGGWILVPPAMTLLEAYLRVPWVIIHAKD